MPWHFSSQQPIYVQIVDAIEQRIFSGAYGMGEKLPSVRELALEAAVNPNTMQRALSDLENKRLVSTQRNSGRTVTTEAAVISEARADRAGRLSADYLANMAALGYEAGEAIGFLRKEEEEDGNHLNDTSAD